MDNEKLANARAMKNDEFYTQWEAIQHEMNAYREYDSNVFTGKTVLLPCDDPEWSNFTKYFALHFCEFGLKKLISTSYAPMSNEGAEFYQPTIFETQHPNYNKKKSLNRGRVFTLEPSDLTRGRRINIDDLQWDYLEGDGDFRSDEVTSIRDEADFVITNPPFSLFREFVDWLIVGDVKFSIIGNTSAPTTKAIFPRFLNDEMWMGRGFANGNAYFAIPDGTHTAYAANVYDPKTKLVHFRNVSWFTNIEHGLRHEPLQLMTTADNIKYSKHKEIRGSGYLRYDNFDAIDVPFTDAIPSDHDGVMGVPPTFLSKYNPSQFEIVGITTSWFDAATKTYPTHIEIGKNGVRSKVSTLNRAAAIVLDTKPAAKIYYEVNGQLFIARYPRILIRRR